MTADNRSGADREVERECMCGANASDLSGLCARCLAQRRSMARATANGGGVRRPGDGDEDGEDETEGGQR